MDYEVMRRQMVDEQIAARGITDPLVIRALGNVPRHAFVPEAFRDSAYEDRPLPIGSGQTISQPYMVALMTACLGLRESHTVLEIGTGSGYQAAILAEIAGHVYSVERFDALRQSSEQLLARLGYANCHLRTGDGTLGWEEHAPYDGIIVTAGAPAVPDSLIAQLKDGGRLVIPVGGRWAQALTVVRKTGGRVDSTDVCGCVFVPLIGKEGWA